MSKKIGFITVVAVQLFFLAGWSIRAEYEIAHGREIILAAKPYDPRHSIRDDFIWITYDISDLQKKLFPKDHVADLKRGRKVFVLLKASKGIYKAVRASFQRPSQKGAIYIRGILQFQFEGKVRLQYGIEKYFVEEGHGNLQKGNIRAHVVVTKAGTPYLKQLYVNGKAI